jgi:WD40 repeat protein
LKDGRILSWSDDGTLRLWYAQKYEVEGDWESWRGFGELGLPAPRLGEALCELKGHEGAVNGALILPDGRILTWSDDGTVRAWSPDGKRQEILDRHSAPVRGVLLLSFRGSFLSWANDGYIRMGYTSRGWYLPKKVMDGCRDVGGALLQDDRYLMWANNSLWLCDPHATERLLLKGHRGVIFGAKCLPDGCVLSWGSDDTLRIWDPKAVPYEDAALDLYSLIIAPKYTVSEADAPYDAPQLLLARGGDTNGWIHWKSNRTIGLRHVSSPNAPIALWQSPRDIDTHCLYEDGTLLVTPGEDSHVLMLKSYRGASRMGLS